MQRVKCLVRLNGDLGNTVQKEGVSPAEIVILNDIHGGPDGDAVVNIQPTEMDKMSHAQERGRLRGIYGHHVVDRLFPGEFSRLPVTLKDIAQFSDQGDEDLGDEDEGDEGGEGDGDQGGDDEAAKRRAAEAQRKRDERARKKAEAEAAANGNQGGGEGQ